MNEHEESSAEDFGRRPAPVVAVEEQEQDGVDLRDVVGVILAGKWIIAAVTAAFIGLAVAYALLWPATYSADTLIQVNQFTPGGSSLATEGSLVAPFLPGNTIAAAEVEIMTSRAVLLPVVRKMHLNIIIDKPIPVIGKLFRSKTPPPLTIEDIQVPDPWKDTNLRLRNDGGGAYTLYSPAGKPVVHGMVGKTASAKDGSVKILVSQLGGKTGRVFKVMRLYDSEAVANLQTNLTATQLGSSSGPGLGSQSGVVQLELEGKNPYAIKKIVNEITDQYMRENIAAMASQAEKSLTFVNAQLPVINQKFTIAQSKLANYEAAKGVVSISDQVQATLQQIVTFETQLTQLEVTRAGLSAEYKPDFPGYAAIAQQEASIRHKIATLNSQLQDIPAQQLQYVQLNRDTQVYGQLYQQLLATQQDLEIQQAGTVGTARIVDHALTPYEPEWPIVPAVIAIGVALGLILGVIVVLLKSALSRGVLDATELERAFGLPVYAIVPHSPTQQKVLKKSHKDKRKSIPLLAQSNPEDPAVEAMRSLRTSLSFAVWDRPRRVVTFSGTSPGVGKSFLSANVAHVLGSANQRVLVVDGDMRKGHLHRYFRVRQTPGLSELLSGQKSREDVLRADPLGNGVDFIPTGAYPPGAFDLVSSPRFEALIDEVGAQYDIVIVDVPPVLAVAEGLVISRLATANFLVIKAGGQTEREIHLALERMRQNGVRLMGFIFNDLTQRAATATFGRYASAGYTYGYYRAEKTLET